MTLPNEDDGRSPSGRAVVNGAANVSALRASVPSAGDEFGILYPFVRDTYTSFDADGCSEMPTWKPGIRNEWISPEETGTVADGVGGAVFTVVDVHKPGRFPTRVFFTRKFVDPDGHAFGKGKLHIVTLDKFRRLARGYRYTYGIGEPLPHHWNPAKARSVFEVMLADYARARFEELGRDPSDCKACDGFGMCWNNADPTSCQWQPCSVCGDTRGHP